MHELSQIQDIVNHIQRKISKESPDGKVKRVNFILGKEAHGNPDSIKTCFEIASRDTSLEGADVSVKIIEGDRFFAESVEVER